MQKFRLYYDDGSTEDVEFKNYKALRRHPKGKSRKIKAIAILSVVGEVVIQLIRLIKSITSKVNKIKV